MTRTIKSLSEAKNLVLDKYTTLVKQPLLRLKNIRKGNRLSRIGRTFLKKFNSRSLVGSVLVISLSTGSLVNPAIWKIRGAGAAQAQTAILEQPQEIITITEKTAQIPLENYRLTQGYHFFHPAIDLAAPIGTPIKPVSAGKIEIINHNTFGLGNYIVIKHGAGFYSVYAHLSQIKVEKNQTVDKETIIGTVGSTGFSTGPHLHLEVIVEEQKINPLSILPTL